MCIRRCAVAAAFLAMTGAAQAALFDRGGGMVYDSTLKITWLSDWNYAKTSGYDVDGRMGWKGANKWATNLVHRGYDDWRLPTSFDPDGGGPCQAYNCRGSEMGHMFYVNWGATAVSNFSTGINRANLALFHNVQPSPELSHPFWSSSDDAPIQGTAWYFYPDGGFQGYTSNWQAFYAVAVRPGDVVAVPEPRATAMMLLGLGAMMMALRRRPRFPSARG
jgi:hypothetical protein